MRCLILLSVLFLFIAVILPLPALELMPPDTAAIPVWPSEIRSPLTRFELLGTLSEPDIYQWNPIYRPLAEIQAGIDVPVFRLRTGGIEWYHTFLFSINVLTDLVGPETAPLITTDFLYGPTIQGIVPVSGYRVRNVSINLRPFLHESSHIGDEFAMHMVANNPENYYRINLSYEAWEFILGINEWKSGKGNTVTVRGGMTGLWGSGGYYSSGITDAEIGSSYDRIFGSDHHFEYSLQVHRVVESGFPAFSGWLFHAGGEIRWREVFEYFESGGGRLRPSFDFTTGWFQNRNQGLRQGFYLELYWGQMTWGMFREEYGHFHAGLGTSVTF